MNLKYRTSLITGAFIFISIACLTLPIHGQDSSLGTCQQNVFYVAPNGNDSDSGCIDKPLKTIAKAVEKINVNSPGKIYVRSGIYAQKFSVRKSDLLISAYPGEKPVFTGQGVNFGSDNEKLIELVGSNIRFSGFELRDIPAKALSTHGNNNIIENNVIHDARRYGIYVLGYGDRDPPDGTIIRNNTVYNVSEKWADYKDLNNSEDDVFSTVGGGWDAAIGNRGNKTLIEGNTVYKNGGEGIMCFGKVKECVIRNNTVYDNWSVNIYLASAADSVVENNFVYVTATGDVSVRRTKASGVTVNTEEPHNCQDGNNEIRNNIFVNPRVGIRFYNYCASNGNDGENPCTQEERKDSCAAYARNRVYNNTFYNTLEWGIDVAEGKNTLNEFINNIFYTRQGRLIKYSNPNPAYFSNYNDAFVKPVFRNNLFYIPNGETNRQFSFNEDSLAQPQFNSSLRRNLTFTQFISQDESIYSAANNIWANPELVAPGDFTIESYMLKTQSPAINTGAILASFQNDFFEKARTGNYDIGAIESETGAIPSIQPDTVTPTFTPIPSSVEVPTVLPDTPADSCQRKKEGDANCDNQVSLVDLEIWRAEFFKEQPTQRSDFSGDNRITLVDLEIWTRTMFE
jgi:parallel beta-helix repeat protein